MIANQILSELWTLGVRLTVEDGKLIAEPLSRVPPDLRARAGEHKAEIIAALRDPETADAEDLSTPENILEVCRRYGVALRIDADGDLVVGKAGAKAHEDSQPWPRLIAALEAHLVAAARLVEAGWQLKAPMEERGA